MDPQRRERHLSRLKKQRDNSSLTPRQEKPLPTRQTSIDQLRDEPQTTMKKEEVDKQDHQPTDSNWRNLSQTREQLRQASKSREMVQLRQASMNRELSQLRQASQQRQPSKTQERSQKRDPSKVSERFNHFLSQVVDDGAEQPGVKPPKEVSQKREASKSPGHFYTADYISYLHKSPHESISPNTRQPMKPLEKK